MTENVDPNASFLSDNEIQGGKHDYKTLIAKAQKIEDNDCSAALKLYRQALKLKPESDKLGKLVERLTRRIQESQDPDMVVRKHKKISLDGNLLPVPFFFLRPLDDVLILFLLFASFLLFESDFQETHDYKLNVRCGRFEVTSRVNEKAVLCVPTKVYKRLFPHQVSSTA
jgi:hypothetical protein